MKHLMLLAGTALLLWGARQTSLPQIVQDNDQKLRAAKSFSATYAVQVVGEAPSSYELVFAKPNLFKVTGPDGFWLSDGKTLFEYQTAANTWTETPISDDSIKTVLNRPAVWGWSSFFLEDNLKKLASAKAGAARMVKGNPTTEVVESFVAEEARQPATVFIDQKLGVVRSYRIPTTGDKEMLVIATDLKLSDEAVDAATFAFTAPAGAKKLEPSKATSEATFAAVQQICNENCMPCHNSQTRRDNIDLTNYHGIRAIVTPGNPSGSRMIMSLRGAGARKMPMNRASLPDAQIKLIEAWIANGAKQE